MYEEKNSPTRHNQGRKSWKNLNLITFRSEGSPHRGWLLQSRDSSLTEGYFVTRRTALRQRAARFSQIQLSLERRGRGSLCDQENEISKRKTLKHVAVACPRSWPTETLRFFPSYRKWSTKGFFPPDQVNKVWLVEWRALTGYWNLTWWNRAWKVLKTNLL